VASSSSGALITVVREGASIIGLFIMMFYYSWQLSIILIVLAPIVSIAIRVVSKRFRNISKNMQNTMMNRPMIDAPSRTTVISAPEEEEAT
ncbi:ABC transporter transmembrane domain-containing protein, partial [Escherichia coli]